MDLINLLYPIDGRSAVSTIVTLFSFEKWAQRNIFTRDLAGSEEFGQSLISCANWFETVCLCSDIVRVSPSIQYGTKTNCHNVWYNPVIGNYLKYLSCKFNVMVTIEAIPFFKFDKRWAPG